LRLPFAHFIKSHHISHAALAVGAVAAAILFFAAGAVIRLLLGPISLGPLAGPLSGAIEDALPGITLKYDQAAVEWARDEGRVNLVVLGAKILDSNGQAVAEAPKADIDLAARPFLQGHIRVQRITLVGVELSLVHMKDGSMRLGAEGDRHANDVLARLNDVIEAKGSATSSLKSFAVRNARISFFDEATGLNVTAPHATLVMAAKDRAIGLHFESDVTISGSSTHVRADMTLPPDKGAITGDALVTNLDLRALAANAPMFQQLSGAALSVNLATHYRVMPGAHISAADFDLTAAGQMPLAALADKTLHVRQLRLSGHYDGMKDHLTLAQASLEAREGMVRLKGAADLHYDKDALAGVSGEIQTSRLALDMPGIFAQPVSFQSLQFAGSYQLADQTLEISRANLAAPGFALSLSGGVALGKEGEAPGLSVTGKLAPLPLKALLRYWPLPLAPGARSWIQDNVFAGQAGPFIFETHFTPGMLDQAAFPDDAFKLTFAVSGVEGNYVQGLTHVTNVSGNATLLGDTFSADFDSGRVGNLVARGGHARIPTLHQHGTVGQFAAHVDGQLPDIMTLIDMKPLGYASRFGIDPKDTHGAASTDLSFTIPMLADLPVDDVGISVKAQVSDFAVTLGRLKLTNGQVNFDIDNNHLRQTGAVNLADARLAVDWLEDFKTADPITTRITARGVVTENARQALRLGLQNILSGPMMVNAQLQGHSGQLTSADVTMDLGNSVLAIPILHLGKPAGLAATGHVGVNFGPGDVPHDETIRVTGPGISANGVANFDRTGSLSVLNFSSVKMGPLNDLSFTLNRTAAGNEYVLRGHSLDGSLIGRNVGETQATDGARHEEPAAEPFHIDAKLDRFAMRDGVAVAPFNLDLSGVGDRPSALALSGGLSKSATLTGAIDTTAQGRRLTLEAGDAGQLIKGLFAFDSIKGGKLKLVANLPGRAGDAPVAAPPTPDYQGTLAIDDFQVENQHLLARLFSAGSLTGLGDLLGGGGISIDRLNVPFSAKNNVLTVHGAIARGPAVGVSADGYIDRGRDEVALKGSLVPAYGLNSVLGNIPILGNVLVSKKGEGIFGVTYSATGNAEEPNIAVNPLSVLAPGIFRRIFEGSMPTAPAAPPPPLAQSNPPKRTN
jgi:hypothetical protein